MVKDPLAYAISRHCMVTSTAVLLLADTIPSLSVSLVAPFLPFYIKYVTFVCFRNQKCEICFENTFTRSFFFSHILCLRLACV